MNRKKIRMLFLILYGLILVFAILLIPWLSDYGIDRYTQSKKTDAELIGKLTVAECVDYNEETDTSTFVTDVTGDVYYLQGYYPMGVVLLGEDNAIIWYPYSDLKCYVEDGLG